MAAVIAATIIVGLDGAGKDRRRHECDNSERRGDEEQPPFQHHRR